MLIEWNIFCFPLLLILPDFAIFVLQSFPLLYRWEGKAQTIACIEHQFVKHFVHPLGLEELWNCIIIIACCITEPRGRAWENMHACLCNGIFKPLFAFSFLYFLHTNPAPKYSRLVPRTRISFSVLNKDFFQVFELFHPSPLFTDGRTVAFCLDRFTASEERGRLADCCEVIWVSTFVSTACLWKTGHL